MFARILLVFAISVTAPTVCQAEEPLRFLTIPIMGTVGADCTLEGVENALELATAGNLQVDALLVEIDALDGELAAGRSIARSILKVPPKIRTIAVVRNAGGAALPILNACSTWIVLESTPSLVDDGEGGRTLRPAGPDRLVLRTLAPLTTRAEAMKANLDALRQAMTDSTPTSLDKSISDARQALARAICDPVLDLQLGADLRAVPALRQQDGGEDAGKTRIRTSRQGPGITAKQLNQTGLCIIAKEGLEPLAAALQVEAVESLGDPGVLLVVDAANERYSERGRINSRIDAMIGALDSADSLVSAMPWTLARARMSLPTSERLRGNFPMEHVEGRWIISPDFRPAWLAACKDSIRRWSGIIEIESSLSSILDRAANLRKELGATNPGINEEERYTAALAVFDGRMKELRLVPGTWAPKVQEAKRTISKIEAWRESPPDPDA